MNHNRIFVDGSRPDVIFGRDPSRAQFLRANV